ASHEHFKRGRFISLLESLFSAPFPEQWPSLFAHFVCCVLLSGLTFASRVNPEANPSGCSLYRHPLNGNFTPIFLNIKIHIHRAGCSDVPVRLRDSAIDLLELMKNRSLCYLS